jgi:hypothetical protein
MKLTPILLAVAMGQSCGFGCETAVRSAASPDGRWVATCVDAGSRDSADQRTTVVESSTQKIVMGQRLIKGDDWCDEIAWSRDSQTVAFLIRGYRLIVNRPLEQHTFERTLIHSEPFEAANIKLDDGGRAATYQKCSRETRPTCMSERLDLP